MRIDKLARLWLIVIAASGLVIAVAPGASALPWIVIAVLSGVTHRRVETEASLHRPLLYRGAIGVALASALVGLGTSARVVALGPGNDRSLGLAITCATFLALAILAYRALVHPSPRRATTVGIVGICGPFLALIADLLVGISLRQNAVFVGERWTDLALFAMLGAWAGGAFACLVAVATFGPATRLPAARELRRVTSPAA